MASDEEVVLKFSVHKYSSYSSNYYPEYVCIYSKLRIVIRKVPDFAQKWGFNV